MVRVGLAAAVVVGMVGAAAGNPPLPASVVPAAAAVGGPLKAVQGYWKPLSIRLEGKPVADAERLGMLTMVYDGDESHLYFKSKKPGAEPIKLARAAVTLDPATRAVTFEYAMGPLKGHKRHGVYEVVGDELRLCYGPADKPRPTKFEAPADSGYYLEVWGKQPPK